jgi:hypothetical protein
VRVAGAAAAVAALGANAFDQGTTADAQPRITLGVLRRDGLMLPFASYDGDWSVPWPEPSHTAALPIGVEDIPKKWWGAAGPDAPWTAWLLGGASRPLKPIAPVMVPVFCNTRLLLRTDYRGGPFDRREPTVPKDGLAIAGQATLLPIEIVPADSPDAREMARTLTDQFNKEESSAARRFTRWKHPVPENARRQIPIEIEAFYRAPETTKRGTWTTMYVEAVRKFPPGPKDEGCGLITYARAWVYERQGEKPRIDLGARVTYCDRADVSFMLPFGRLHLNDETYWVYQTSSWRDELYTVTRIEPKEVRPVVVVSGGLCYR